MTNTSLIWQKKLPRGTFQVYKEKPSTAISVKQIHGAQVLSLQEAKKQSCEGDGLYWHWDNHDANYLPMVLTADCLPVVILGDLGGAILHAGWKGVKEKIYLNSHVSNLRPYYYFIGPSIQQNSFEVTSEFLNYFPNKDFFTTRNDRYAFNLQKQVVFDLQNAYPAIKGEDCGIDTYTDLRFQSFRRDKKNRTNNYNIFNFDR